ncbi:MAG: DUF4443 domain-containing protein [Candidatus Helarchaeota archaeon]
MLKGPEIRKTLKKIIDNRAPGPKSNLFVFHFEQALRLIAEGDIDRKNKPIGRQKLAEILGLGGGSIRSLLKMLKNEDLIETSKTGNELTKKGQQFLTELKKQIPKKEIKINLAKKITNSENNYALLIKNCRNKIGTGMEQRDAAMKIGATGAITIVFKEGKYCIPQIQDFNDLKTRYPNFITELEKNFKIKPNDVVIIGTANIPILAKTGVWAAAYSLIL